MINADKMQFRFDNIDQMHATYELHGSHFCDMSQESQQQAREFLKQSLLTHVYGDANSAMKELYASLVMLIANGKPLLDDPNVIAAFNRLKDTIPIQ